ncbi:MAG: hypothetical protein Q8O26_08275 [Phreatobacter sp.]|uniref:hypothetical protein n=1 Tax=Phreatobacter sp. TaxID=1966341 RepID=UPI0027325AF1|nr:hypothetical protein [Phreatobacter sp.]MDP2801863.1 hypothetical protein [Phreatobacter sp.]
MFIRSLLVGLLATLATPTLAQTSYPAPCDNTYCVGDLTRPDSVRNSEAVSRGFNVSRVTGAPLDPTKLYVISVTSTASRDATPLVRQGLFTNQTTYLSLNIFFDTDAPGVVVPANPARIAVSPYTMSKDASGATIRIEEMSAVRFVTRGDLRRLRVEVASVEDTAPNDTTKALKLFLSLLSPINALLNVGSGTFFGKLAAQGSSITSVVNDLSAAQSAKVTRTGSTALNIRPRGVTTYTISSPISQTTISIQAVASLGEVLNNDALYPQIRSVMDLLADTKVGNDLAACSRIAGDLGLEYAGLALTDKALILGYVGTRRAGDNVFAKLDCVGEDLVQRSEVQTALIGARYNAGLVRARIDRAGIDDYLRQREVGDFFETLAADYMAAAGATDGDRAARTATVLQHFDPSIALSDPPRTLGLPAAQVSSQELVQAMIGSGIYWLGCRSSVPLRPGYAHFIAGLPREPRPEANGAAGANFPLADVRGIQLALAKRDNRHVISSLFITRSPSATGSFHSQRCHPDAKAIGPS